MLFILPAIVCYFTLAFPGQAQITDSQVSNITVEIQSEHRILVAWDELENASKYHVRVLKPAGTLFVKKKTEQNQVVIKHLKPNKTYTIKIKAKIDNDFTLYSEPTEVATATVNSITLSTCAETTNAGNENQSTKNVCWSVDGYSQYGYKLVWSQTAEPVYPTRDSDTYSYFSNPETEQGEIYDFDGTGTYYVRVCEYLGGACGVYSNEIEVEL